MTQITRKLLIKHNYKKQEVSNILVNVYGLSIDNSINMIDYCLEC